MMTTAKTVRVVLDTSALRSSSLDSGPFEALARLAEAGSIEIFLPEVAVNEFNTLPSKKREAKEALTKALHAAKKALPKSKQDVLENIDQQVSQTFEDFEKGRDEQSEEVEGSNESTNSSGRK